MGAVDGMLLHVSILAAGNITPSQPSPIKGGGLLSGFGPQPKTFLPKNYTGIDILNGCGIVVVGVGDA